MAIAENSNIDRIKSRKKTEETIEKMKKIYTMLYVSI